MSTEKTIQSFTDRYFDVSLISEVVTPAISYDAEPGKTPGMVVQVARNGMTCRVKSVRELVSCIRRFLVDPLQYATDEPTALATAVSFLAGEGRIVADHALFEGIADSRDELRSKYLPRWEPPLLVWFEVTGGVRGKRSVVRRSLRLEL